MFKIAPFVTQRYRLEHLVYDPENISEQARPYFRGSVTGETYTCLWDRSDAFLVMCDTEMEYKTNQCLINSAYGDVLILGLGIGLVNHLLYEKSEVRSVTIIERFEELVPHIEPYIRHEKLNEIVTVDATNLDLVEKALGNKKFDVVWNDITDKMDFVYSKGYRRFLKGEDSLILRWDMNREC